MPTVNSNPYWEYLPTHAISNLPKNAPCGAALPVGNTVNGSTGKNDTIAAVNQVWVVYDGMSQIVGYVYTTGGGQQYFQLAGSFDLSGSVGIGFAAIGVGYSNVAPIIPWNGSLTSAIGTIINLSGFAGKSFVGYSAPIFNAIMAGKGTVKTWQC